MKHFFTFALMGLTAGRAFAAAPSAADILAKVSAHYRGMRLYFIDADTRVSFTQGGRSGASETRTVLAVGKQGAFRVERIDNGVPEVRVSDGKVTWKSLPFKKVWSKEEVAQEANPEDTGELPGRFEPQDLFTQAERDLVGRYTALEKYASVAQMEKPERVKFNGQKVECFVVQIPTPGEVIRLEIAQDSFFVVRHVAKDRRKADLPSDVVTEFKKIEEGEPPAELFEFAPSGGSKEVASVILPGEREVSLVGQQAMDFTLDSLAGAPVHLADLRGKIVLLDFWATWCEPCREELPAIEALGRKYKDRNVVVLGINNESVGTAKRFLEKYHPDLETLHDSGRKVTDVYGCNAVPTVIVINPQGKVVAHFIGTRSGDVLISALKDAGLR